MPGVATRTVFDVITDFLAADPTPEELITYHLPDDLQARVDRLVERNADGQLTFDEQQHAIPWIVCSDAFCQETFVRTNVYFLTGRCTFTPQLLMAGAFLK